MKGWVGLVGWPVADGLPTSVVTRQLQVDRSTGKVRRPKTDVLPLCHATEMLLYKLQRLWITGADDGFSLRWLAWDWFLIRPMWAICRIFLSVTIVPSYSYIILLRPLFCEQLRFYTLQTRLTSPLTFLNLFVLLCLPLFPFLVFSCLYYYRVTTCLKHLEMSEFDRCQETDQKSRKCQGENRERENLFTSPMRAMGLLRGK